MFTKFNCIVVIGIVLIAPPSSFAQEVDETHEPNQPNAAAEDDGLQSSHEAHIGEEGVSKDVAEFQPDLAVYSLIVFLLLFATLWKFAWKPIAAALDKREANIRQDIADAEAARQKAQQMLAEHEQKLANVQDEVSEILAEARRDAEHTKRTIMETAQKEAEASKLRAITEIERARDGALTELFATASAQVAEATEHVLGRSLNDDDRDRLVGEALSEFSQQLN